MVESIIKNPFVGCTARDMQFDEVKEYWCSPFSLYKLNENDLFSSRTPIVIEGIRGSGKTMILKYLSYPVQKEALKEKTVNERLEYLKSRSFGTYFRYKIDFCAMVAGLECEQAFKDNIFKQYFELFVVREMIESINDIYNGDVPLEMIQAVSLVLSAQVNSLNEALDEVNNRIFKLDAILNGSIFTDAWKEEISPLLINCDYIRGLVKNISENVNGWSDILFSVILDEYENLFNFTGIVNTLIKQVDETCNLTFRIGMRPAGMEKDNSTRVGVEKLQVDRDYILQKLVCVNNSEYRKFAFDVSSRRLSNVEFYADNKLTDITAILGKEENFDLEAKEAAKSNKQFELITKLLPKNKSKRNEAIRLLSSDEKLLEMYNILLVSRDGDYFKVAETSKEYVELRASKQLKYAKGDVRKYNFGYSDKYRLALLFLLRAIYGDSKWYYSFNTFLHLSSGSINDFISLCRNTFKYLNGEMLEELVDGKQIPVSIQTYGAKDTAEDQMRKVAQSNKHGNEMYSFIENLGGAFEEYHRDPEVKYPETNQFAFADEIQIRNDPELNGYLIDLINSGVIIRKLKRQLKSVGQTRGNIYQLNRIFAPHYQYSFRTRGGYNQIISTELFRKMLKEEVPPIKIIKGGVEAGSDSQDEKDDNQKIHIAVDDDPQQMTVDDYLDGLFN